ncbi:hypothetical protein MCOR27_009950 [Pyricularia oryzae]|nr:hypothetical protein MCOR19_006626 [Pyricularia oryzae]KAI6268942.1 hypothetical protein MCOR27_009950 [Pyricularia oryzae]KAI6324906.1 hypothetical protein MCOR30_007010 [Pyricularia oryzae]KAI6460936.1 hypothetical protein MCOR15_005251 [Pyricularia oryzae]KAI6497177.1 hypothetical protein MCOR18_000517 [Pyricularia oryzae]
MPPRKRARSMSSEEGDFEQSAKRRHPMQKRKMGMERSDDNMAADFGGSQIDNTQTSDGGRLFDDIASIRRDALEELRSHAEESHHSKASKQPKETEDTLRQIQTSNAGTKEKVELFRAGRALFIACGCAITSTEKYAGRLKDIQRPHLEDATLEQWQQDIASLERIVDFGHQYGKHLSECAITGTRPYTPGSNEVDEDGMFTIEIFERSTSAVAKDKSWGSCARKHVKGLKMLAPTAEEGRSHSPPLGR